MPHPRTRTSPRESVPQRKCEGKRAGRSSTGIARSGEATCLRPLFGRFGSLGGLGRFRRLRRFGSCRCFGGLETVEQEGGAIARRYLFGLRLFRALALPDLFSK